MEGGVEYKAGCATIDKGINIEQKNTLTDRGNLNCTHPQPQLGQHIHN